MARAMLGLGYGTLGMAEVQASTDAPNRASVRVMERLGMRFHRRLLDGPRETVVYRLHRTEFRPEAACQGTHGGLLRGG
jgi:RimJ/RimL family protein N-acetyltransferase